MIRNKSLIFLLSFLFILFISFSIHPSILSKYTPQLVAILFLLFYLLKHTVLRSKNITHIEVLFLTFIIMSLINITGKTQSPYFFLIYFLIFSISFLLTKELALLANTILLSTFFIFTPFNYLNMIIILSLLLILPFSFYLSYEREKLNKINLKLQETTENNLLFIHLKLKSKIKLAEKYLESKELSKLKKLLRNINNILSKYEG